MTTKQANGDPTERMIAVLERIEAELRGVNKRLAALEKHVTGVEVQRRAALTKRIERLEAAVFKPAAE